MKPSLWCSVGLGSLLAGCASDNARPAEAGVDAEARTDAGTDPEPDAALEECPDQFEPWGRTFVDEINFEGHDEWYELTVMAVLPDGFDLQAPSMESDAPTVEVRFPVPVGQSLELLDEGEAVLVKGFTCDSGVNSGYVRVTTLEGEIVWEGGDPFCCGPGEDFTGPDELPEFHFRLVEIPDALPCWWTSRGPRPPPECCCDTRTDWQVMFVFEDPPRPMAPGESTIVTIDGRRYYAASQGGYHTVDGPCTFDGTYWFGSAFLARLAD